MIDGTPRLQLTSHRAYLDSFRRVVEHQLRARYGEAFPRVTMEQLKREQGHLLRCPALDVPGFERNPQRTIAKYDEMRLTPLEQESIRIMVQSGRLFTEHTVGGLATRINDSAQRVRFGPKYFMRPKDMAREIGVCGYDTLLDLTLGERHFLQLAYALVKLARQMGGDRWTEVLDRQNLSVVDNTRVNGQIVESFTKFGFFGFSPKRVLFNSSEFYAGLVLEDGKLYFDSAVDEKGNLAHSRIHNHGIVPMQACMENTFFTIDPHTGQRNQVARHEYLRILKSVADLISFNVEDLDFFADPLDLKAIGIAMQFAQAGFRMVQDVMRQKQPPLEPQKGGMLCLDPTLFDSLTSQMGRLVIRESFELDLPPEKNADGTPNPAYQEALRKFGYINRNTNQYPHPAEISEILERHGLPVYPDVYREEDGALRIGNLSPQGDINLLVPTAYVFRDSAIRSLKARSDLALTLERLKAQDEQDNGAFRSWLGREFIAAGVVYPDQSFTEITKLDRATPINLSTLLAHPWLMKRLEPRYRDTLESLQEVFKVEGSLIYSVRQQGEKAMLRVAQDSRRGTGLDYRSRAGEEEVPALDIKEEVFRRSRVWAGYKQDGKYSYILVCNRQPGESAGELVLLLGTYDESVPNNRKPFLLREKLAKVLEYGATHGRDEREVEQMAKEFENLPWRFLFENGASNIEQELETRLFDAE